MKIVIPMAGKGSRFLENANANPEYKKPKPLINIKGKPMIKWALKSLDKFEIKEKNLIFICRKDHQHEYKIADSLKLIFGQNINIILLDTITRGALETALKAKVFINTDEEIIISDSDHYFDGSALYSEIQNKKPITKGIIPIFQPHDKEAKWSYTLFDKNFKALVVGEKEPNLAQQGAYANIGAYYFASGKFFVNHAEQMIKEGQMYGAIGKQEFYVAPLYQKLISDGYIVKVAITPKMWGLGTPKDVEYFEENFTSTS